MSESGSYRQILRSSSIIGGAAVVNVVVGLLRTKVVAILLGPSGIGLIGLFGSVMSTAASVAGLGFSNAGTRQIAEAAGRANEDAVAAARRALFWGTFALAIVGGGAFWMLRSVLAEHVLGDPSMAGDVGWLAVGVSLSVASASQGALLNGLRRIGDLARISIVGGVLSSVAGVAVIVLWGSDGIVAFVISGALVGFLLGHYFVAKVKRVRAPRTPFRVLAGQWSMLGKLGAAFMVSGVLVAVGQLFTRVLINREAGADALGHFQAAWAISMTYIGFVLQAMGTDYYPRLTASIHDHPATNRLVNEQTEVALLLAGPVFVAMLGLAPWVIDLLYSSQFGEAASVLRWQVLGDVLKVASWPLGFIILASGDGRTFMLTESLAMVFFVGGTWIGLPLIGVEAAGVSFFVMYLVYLPVVFWLAKRRTGFRWAKPIFRQLTLLLGLSAIVFLVSCWSEWLGAGTGIVMAALLGLYGAARLGRMADLGGGVGRLSAVCQAVMKKLGVWCDA